MQLSCKYCKSQENVRQKLAYYLQSKPVYWAICAKCEKERYTKMFKEFIDKEIKIMNIPHNAIPYMITINRTTYDQDTPPTLEEVIAENYHPDQPLGDKNNEISITK